jgi:hypothetical protein
MKSALNGGTWDSMEREGDMVVVDGGARGAQGSPVGAAHGRYAGQDRGW